MFPGHDPGGKTKMRLLPGVNGDAVFAGPDDCYRPLLRRWTGDAFPEAFAMFLGMNPSVAGAEINDPTIGREWEFTTSWGMTGLVKVNVVDYRLSDPRKLKSVEVPLESKGNAAAILDHAERASRIVIAHGNLPAALRPFGSTIVMGMRVRGLKLWCFAKNADGSPKHSLYVKGGTELIPF